MLTSDNELLGRYVHVRDEDAFEQLIRRHSAMVMGVCQSMLWQIEDAEDAFQATFLLLSTRAPRLLRHNSVGGWLHEVATRTCLKLRREIGRIREVEMAEEPVSKLGEPWRKITVSHDREMLHKELSRLPKRHREAIVLVHLEGKSRSQAAAILDCTTASVKGVLARGRKILRQRLIRHGVVASTVLGTVTTSNVARAAVNETLINATLDHCQGVVPDIGVGTSPEVVQSLIQKELTMGLFGSTKVAAATACFTLVGTLSLAAIAGNIPMPTVQEVTTIELNEDDFAQDSLTMVVNQDQLDKELTPPPLLPPGRPTAGLSGGGGGGAALGSRGSLGSGLGGAVGDAPATGIGPAGGGMSFGVDLNQKLMQQIDREIAKLNNQAAKTKTETWSIYVQRLRDSNYISQQQFADWKAGKPIEIKHELTVTDHRLEKRTRQVPVTRLLPGGTRVETRTRTIRNPDGTLTEQKYEVRVPAIQASGSESGDEGGDGAESGAGNPPVVEEAEPTMVTQEYTVAIPYQRKIVATLTLPALGSTNKSNGAPGFIVRSIQQKPLSKGSQQAGFDKKTRSKILRSIRRPKQKGANVEELIVDSPDSYEITSARTVGDKIGHRGWVVTARDNGRTVRQMFDINGDGKIDNWIYFKNGKETYREVDLDFDRKVDQYQYTEGTSIRYGIDKDQDGNIDEWTTDR